MRAESLFHRARDFEDAHLPLALVLSLEAVARLAVALVQLGLLFAHRVAALALGALRLESLRLAALPLHALFFERERPLDVHRLGARPFLGRCTWQARPPRSAADGRLARGIQRRARERHGGGRGRRRSRDERLGRGRRHGRRHGWRHGHRRRPRLRGKDERRCRDGGRSRRSGHRRRHGQGRRPRSRRCRGVGRRHGGRRLVLRQRRLARPLVVPHRREEGRQTRWLLAERCRCVTTRHRHGREHRHAAMLVRQRRR